MQHRRRLIACVQRGGGQLIITDKKIESRQDAFFIKNYA